MSRLISEIATWKFVSHDVSQALIQSQFRVKKHFSQPFTAIPVMDKHYPTHWLLTLTMVCIYIVEQIAAKDTQSTLLNCFCAPSSAIAGWIISLLFSGRSSRAP